MTQLIAMVKAAVSPLTSHTIRGKPSSLLRVWVWVALLVLFFPVAKAAVACGTTGFQEFTANGVDLRAAAACYVLGTNCTSVGGSNATVTSTYGDDISYWCTGLVNNFNDVFKNMFVSDFCL